MNPQVDYTLERFSIKDIPSDIDGIFLLYENEDFFIEVYNHSTKKNTSNSSTFLVDPYIFLAIIKDFTGIPFLLGKEDLKLYNSKTHREVIFLRLSIPNSLLQIEYQDGEEEIPCSKLIETFLRNKLSIA